MWGRHSPRNASWILPFTRDSGSPGGFQAFPRAGVLPGPIRLGQPVPCLRSACGCRKGAGPSTAQYGDTSGQGGAGAGRLVPGTLTGLRLQEVTASTSSHGPRPMQRARPVRQTSALVRGRRSGPAQATAEDRALSLPAPSLPGQGARGLPAHTETDGLGPWGLRSCLTCCWAPGLPPALDPPPPRFKARCCSGSLSASPDPHRAPRAGGTFAHFPDGIQSSGHPGITGWAGRGHWQPGGPTESGCCHRCPPFLTVSGGDSCMPSAQESLLLLLPVGHRAVGVLPPGGGPPLSIPLSLLSTIHCPRDLPSLFPGALLWAGRGVPSLLSQPLPPPSLPGSALAPASRPLLMKLPPLPPSSLVTRQPAGGRRRPLCSAVWSLLVSRPHRLWTCS